MLFTSRKIRKFLYLFWRFYEDFERVSVSGLRDNITVIAWLNHARLGKIKLVAHCYLRDGHIVPGHAYIVRGYLTRLSVFNRNDELWFWSDRMGESDRKIKKAIALIQSVIERIVVQHGEIRPLDVVYVA